MSTIASGIRDIQSSEPTPISIGIDIERQLPRNVFVTILYETVSSLLLNRQNTAQVSPTEQKNLMAELLQLDLVLRSLTGFGSGVDALSSATSTLRIDTYETLRQTVIENFKSMPEVQFIYQDIADNNLTFWIFTNEQHYDDALMDRLIVQEQEILDLYPGTPLMFEYIPWIFCPNPADVIGNTAKQIYQV